MRSLRVLGRLAHLGASYVWDYWLPWKRSDEGMLRFASRVRVTLLELGGVYIKLGQLVATRPDLIDPLLAKELEVLLDKVPPEPLEASKATIREEFGLTPNCPLPFLLVGGVGSASFGCVYRVQLESGETAAIKVQRSGIQLQSVGDLKFLVLLARLLDLAAVTHRYRIVDWIKELREWTAEELDYRLEARRMAYIGKNIRRLGGIKVPRVIWPLTTRRVLTMEFLEGRWLSDEHASFKKGELSRAASALFQAFLYQTFELGFFHADQHRGNMCVMDDGRIGVVDFGITGFVSQRTRMRHLGLVAALQRGAIDEAFASLLEISFVPPDADLALFKKNFEKEYYDWFLHTVEPDALAENRGAGALMLAVFRRAYECSIVIDNEVVRYYRAFAIVDSVVSSLDRRFSQHEEIDYYLKSRLRRQMEDLAAKPFDPIGTLVAITTEFAFRTSEFRRIIYGYSTSVDTAIARVLLVIAGLKRHLSRLAWAAAVFSMTLGLLVRAHILSPRAVFLQSGIFGHIDVGDLTEVVGPMILVALTLGWFGRLLRARAYSSSQPEPGREARGVKK